jgi:hypothetical protein
MGRTNHETWPNIYPEQDPLPITQAEALQIVRVISFTDGEGRATLEDLMLGKRLIEHFKIKAGYEYLFDRLKEVQDARRQQAAGRALRPPEGITPLDTGHICDGNRGHCAQDCPKACNCCHGADCPTHP